MDKIDDSEVLQSLNADRNKEQVFKAKESAGKSGSFFFFSNDKKFLIKTMNDTEMKVFQQMLPQYLRHFQNNTESLLARIYGLFTVQMEGFIPVHVLIMQNSAQTGKLREYAFDLKGSEINREVTDPESAGTLKDMNLVKLTKRNILMRF